MLERLTYCHAARWVFVVAVALYACGLYALRLLRTALWGRPSEIHSPNPSSMSPSWFRSTPARFALWGGGLWMLFATLTRVALLLLARRDLSWDASLPGALLTGLGFDLGGAVFAALPWALVAAIAPQRLWQTRAGRMGLFGATMLFSVVLVFIGVAECVFWEEFGARFNFIAVDYLIWTQEVWSNIWESYPMVWITLFIVLVGAAVAWAGRKSGAMARLSGSSCALPHRIVWPFALLALAAAILCSVSQSSMPAFANQYNAELAKNGCWSFCTALRHMELDYEDWYRVLPGDEAVQRTSELLADADNSAALVQAGGLSRQVAGRGPEKRWNVMTICMESMSGDYMSYLGNAKGLTPNLDRLTRESLFFNHLYATGTRTVRGMEALTLHLPPTPGQAIIYRPEGTNLSTSFEPFLDRGYDCAFLYGGDGRFDFMNRYFSTAGCRIADVGAWNEDDVTYKTAWGACDGDLFHKAIIDADRDHLAGKPFHFFCMTTSNHRPYGFPADTVEVGELHGRKAAVKYADWALGRFLEEAATHEWFHNTLFVICSDHCASSAGKMELDVTKYHIPAMLYAPGLVQPQQFDTVCSQIDVMPTVFGLLNWSYRYAGYGRDLLAPENAGWSGRAFLSNYQKIALLRDGRIAILKPNRRFTLANCDLATGALEPLEQQEDDALLRDATACYQSASWLFSSGRLKRHAQPEVPGIAHHEGASIEPPLPPNTLLKVEPPRDN